MILDVEMFICFYLRVVFYNSLYGTFGKSWPDSPLYLIAKANQIKYQLLLGLKKYNGTMHNRYVFLLKNDMPVIEYAYIWIWVCASMHTCMCKCSVMLCYIMLDKKEQALKKIKFKRVHMFWKVK